MHNLLWLTALILFLSLVFLLVTACGRGCVSAFLLKCILFFVCSLRMLPLLMLVFVGVCALSQLCLGRILTGCLGGDNTRTCAVLLLPTLTGSI